jgi:hypothetical protein
VRGRCVAVHPGLRGRGSVFDHRRDCLAMPAQNLPGLMLDRSHPLARGLVGWWPLNEGGGTRVADVGSYQNPGAFGNITPSSTSGWSGGPHGRAVRFDGSDDIISVPHSASLALTGDMSACAWVNVTSVASPHVPFNQNAAIVGDRRDVHPRASAHVSRQRELRRMRDGHDVI